MCYDARFVHILERSAMFTRGEIVPRKKVTVLLFDGDGCIYNNSAIQRKKREIFLLPQPHWSERDVVEGNGMLFDYIQSRVNPNRDISILCGSNRQSFGIDCEVGKMGHTGSFYPVLEHIANYLSVDRENVTLLPFLLADIFCDKTIGESFVLAKHELAASNPPDPCWMLFGNQPITKIHTPIAHPNCPLETTKVLWMKTVLNYLAETYPETEFDEVECLFFDDKESILDGLQEWLVTNPELMPRHISLEQHQYDGSSAPRPYAVIRGTGEIDIDYRNTAKMLAYLAGLPPESDWMSPVSVNVQCSLNHRKVTLQTLNQLRHDWPELIASAKRSLCTVPCISPVSGDEDEASYSRRNFFVQSRSQLRRQSSVDLSADESIYDPERQEGSNDPLRDGRSNSPSA